MSTNSIKTEHLRHSGAHILAQAVLRHYPASKLGIGPATDTGFYYDIDLGGEEIVNNKKFLQEIEAEMNRIIEEELPFKQVILDRSEAIDMLHQQGQIYKSELLQQIDDPEVSFYKTGEEFIDLCRGPHVNDTGKVGAVKLKSIEEVHWLGDEERPTLTRIYGVAFKSKLELEEYEREKRELRNRDHTKTGKSLAIYDPTDRQGMNTYTLLPHGVKMRETLTRLFTDKLEEENYNLVSFKNIWDKLTFSRNELAGFYAPDDVIPLGKDKNITNYQIAQAIDMILELNDSEEEILSSPNKIIYKNTTLWLDEESTLEGTEKEKGLYESSYIEQLNLLELVDQENFIEQVKSILQTLITTYKRLLGDSIFIKSTVKEKKLEEKLTEILPNLGAKVTKYTSDHDFLVQLIYIDLFENEWELANISTKDVINDYIQKYKANFKDFAHLIMLKSEIIVNLERLIALTIEKYDGYLPIEVAPYHAVIIPEKAEYVNYARTILLELKSNRIRIKGDFSDTTMTEKLSRARRLKYPFILTVGEQEEKNHVFSVKPTTGEDLGLMNMKEFLQKIDQLS